MPDADRLTFGTAALGLPYGLARNGVPPALMEEESATALVNFALDHGLTTFDTAPAYGVAEERLGHALRGRGAVWTKLSASGGSLVPQLDTSLHKLRRERIDLLQWHNWTAKAFESSAVLTQWEALRRDGRLRAVGASTYGVTDARDAIVSGLFDVVQIEWNLLNQGVLRAVADEAVSHGVLVALRSVYLQGALTDEGRSLPRGDVLAQGIARAGKRAREMSMPLEHLALRAALDQEHARWIVLGFDSAEQVALAKSISEAPSLAFDVEELDLGGHPETDPRTWPK